MLLVAPAVSASVVAVYSRMPVPAQKDVPELTFKVSPVPAVGAKPGETPLLYLAFAE